MDTLFEFETSLGVVRGVFSKPPLKKFPVLLVLHGFSGDSIGPQYLLRTFQKQCIEESIGVLRFDYIGCGNSDGDFTENNVTTSLSQSEEVLNFLLGLNEVTEVYTLGFSMGGVIASELVKKHPIAIKKLLLWSPAGNMGELLHSFYENSPKLSENKAVYGGLILTEETVEDANKYDVYNDLALYKNEACVIHGSLDSVVPIKHGKMYYDHFDCRKYFYEVPGSEHTYENINFRYDLFRYSLNFLKEPLYEEFL